MSSMKRNIVRPLGLIALLAPLGAAGCGLSDLPSEADPASAPPEWAGSSHRARILTTPPSEMGIAPGADFPNVYGVLMEWRMGEHETTLVSLNDGSASLYSSSAMGVIEGVDSESAREASIRFVRTAEKFYAEARVAEEFPYPLGGHTFFYLLCFDGVRVMVSHTDMLADRRDPRHELWGGGQRVVNELLLAKEQSGESWESRSPPH